MSDRQPGVRGESAEVRSRRRRHGGPPLRIALVVGVLLVVVAGAALAVWIILSLAQKPPPPSIVFLILMENHNWADVKGNPSAPYLNNVLLPAGSHAEQYYNPPGI